MKRLKMKPVFVQCLCGSRHATWWKTTPPPGCKKVADD